MSEPGAARPTVVFGGLRRDDAVWLGRRLDLEVVAAESGADVLEAVARVTPAALVLDDRIDAPRGAALLAQVRDRLGLTALPVIYCLELGCASDFLADLVDRFGVEQILFHPLDREELTRQLARTLRILIANPTDEPDGRSRQVSAALLGLWQRYREENLGRVVAIEGAVRLLLEDRLDEAARRDAEREAHKLVGALGTFGFPRASEVARHLETELRNLEPGEGAPSRSERLFLAEKVARLRRELDDSSRADPPSSESDGRPVLLIVDANADVAHQVATEARRRGLRPTVVASAVAAVSSLASAEPDVVLLGFGPEDVDDSLALLANLVNRPTPIPVVVTAARDGLIDRVSVAQLGARGFLPRRLGPVQTLDAVIQLIVRLRATRSTVLAVDDDPSIHGALQALLAPHGPRVISLTDPLRFWETLETASPDLVILDVDMPRVSGIELCRVIRNDSRWSSLPILFLTANNDPDLVHRLFQAGADDYVRKPIVGPELVTRLLNRLERTRLLRTLAETDALSGVANRRKSSEMIEQYLHLGDRYHQAVALAILDLDHFKTINDEHGHASGDEVVRRLGNLLRSSFRAEDVVGRWGGEEFVVGMYGMSRRDGVRRLGQVLDALRREEFIDPSGELYHVCFSAGIVQYPEDGRDLQTLYRRADEALYRAKHLGRGRVVAAEPSTSVESFNSGAAGLVAGLKGDG